MERVFAVVIAGDALPIADDHQHAPLKGMEYKLQLGFTSHHCKTKLKLVLHAAKKLLLPEIF